MFRVIINTGVCVVFVLAGIASCVCAVETDETEVRRLVARLDSDRLAERDDAEDALIALAETAVPFLPTENALMEPNDFSEEQIVRLKNVYQAIRAQKIEKAVKKIEFHLESAEATTGERYWIRLQTRWAEDVKPIRFLFPMRGLEGKDASGNAVFKPVSRAASLEIPVTKNQHTGTLEFAVVSDSATKNEPKTISGECRVLLSVGEKTFSFKNIPFDGSEPKGGIKPSHRQGDVVLTIESARIFSNPGDGHRTLSLQLRIQFDRVYTALESHRTWIYDNKAVLWCQTDKSIEPIEVRPVAQQTNEITLALSFDIQNEKPVEFRYTLPTILTEKTVEFTAETR